MTGNCRRRPRNGSRSSRSLIATAIANAESSAELAASRRRIVAAADEARRRIERDLHDGIAAAAHRAELPRARDDAKTARRSCRGLATELAEGLKDAFDELREVSRGIHPTILTEAGLGPALRALARRSDVPIERRRASSTSGCRRRSRRPRTTSPRRRSRTSRSMREANVVELIAARGRRGLALEVRDDGDRRRRCRSRLRHLIGLTDRVEALGGTISIASPPHGGTTVSRATCRSRREPLLRTEEGDHGQNAAMIVRRVRELQLLEDVPHMLLDGALGEPENPRDPGVRAPLRHQRQDLTLARRQPLERIARPRAPARAPRRGPGR